MTPDITFFITRGDRNHTPLPLFEFLKYNPETENRVQFAVKRRKMPLQKRFSHFLQTLCFLCGVLQIFFD